MGNINYELPDHLGTLTLTVPSHWVGARAEGVEALWIDQQSDGFKENVTLKIRTVAKVEEPENLLDFYVDKFLKNTGVVPISVVLKKPLRRDFSFDNQIEDHALRQDESVLYAETATNSYLITLSSTHLRSSDNVDLDSAEILSD